MIRKILYQIFWLLLTALVVGYLFEFFGNRAAYFISFSLTILGFVFYPEKKDFGSRLGMLLFPILAVIVFNINLSLTTSEFPDAIIVANVLVGLFCFITSLLHFKRKPNDDH